MSILFLIFTHIFLLHLQTTEFIYRSEVARRTVYVIRH